jgi:hypothetical protein
MTPEERDRLVRLEERVAAFSDDMVEIKGDVKRIASVLDQSKGGWRAAMFLMGLSATIGAAVAKIAALPFPGVK